MSKASRLVLQIDAGENTDDEVLDLMTRQLRTEIHFSAILQCF